jgi:hypothetical protein
VAQIAKHREFSDFSEPAQLDIGTAYKGRRCFDTSVHTSTSFLLVHEVSIIVGLKQVPHASAEIIYGGSFWWAWEIRRGMGRYNGR